MPRYPVYCDTCDGRLDIGQDDPEEFPEAWCPRERACEEPGCGVSRCGDEAPRPCDRCGFDHCEQHLHRWAGDAWLCAECLDEWSGKPPVDMPPVVE